MSGETIEAKFNLAKPVHFLALGFGSGLIKPAPGTWGTLAAVPLYLLLSELSIEGYLSVLVLLSLAGIWICGKCAEDVGVHDHPAIVWDEFAGYLLTMAFIEPTWQNIIAGFLLFRLFDIAKPWPIGYFDRKVRGGFGIMFDDILAGVFAFASLHLLQAIIN